jgi:hypothetical protein
MATGTRRFTAVLLGLALVLTAVPGARAEEPDDVPGLTPPRLSYVEGEVSFFRPGAQDWSPAQVNTPLAPGDELYTGNRGNLEIQVGAGEFVRAWGDTQLGVVDQETNALQLKVTTGHVVLDLRSVEPGRSVEVATPQAALTIDAPGYYRVDVTGDHAAFVARRGGRASLTTASGSAIAVAPEQQVTVAGAAVQQVAAPPADVWDTWNQTRTNYVATTTASARHVPAAVYGASELDRYGDWRPVPDYGSVWVPRGVPVGWAPYSTGRWIADPYYGWTWVDAAPWGWAPYHYGRWVFVNGYWGWAPGPVVVRPVYAPALVVFFGAPGVRVAVGSPFVSWVALGWGEPVVPWWGRPHFAGRPWWGGWGGPRVVNNVVIHRTTVVNVTNITVYRNTNVRNAVVAVREDGFRGRRVQETRVTNVDVRRLEPVHGRLPVKPDARSFSPGNGPGTRPPEQTVGRRVVTTRPPAARPDRDGDRRDGDDRDRDGRPDRDDRARDRRDGDGGRGDRARPDGAPRVTPPKETATTPVTPKPTRPTSPGVEKPTTMPVTPKPTRPTSPGVEKPTTMPVTPKPTSPTSPEVEKPTTMPVTPKPTRPAPPGVEKPTTMPVTPQPTSPAAPRPVPPAAPAGPDPTAKPPAGPRAVDRPRPTTPPVVTPPPSAPPRGDNERRGQPQQPDGRRDDDRRRESPPPRSDRSPESPRARSVETRSEPTGRRAGFDPAHAAPPRVQPTPPAQAAPARPQAQPRPAEQVRPPAQPRTPAQVRPQQQARPQPAPAAQPRRAADRPDQREREHGARAR